MATVEIHASAAELRAHLNDLFREWVLAEATGLVDCEAYMADLVAEIVECRLAFLAAAVTEIAVLRAELSGPQVG
jgi:hypothetical protein